MTWKAVNPDIISIVFPHCLQKSNFIVKEESFKNCVLLSRFLRRKQDLMLTIALHRPGLSILSQNGTRDYRHIHRVSASWTMYFSFLLSSGMEFWSWFLQNFVS